MLAMSFSSKIPVILELGLRFVQPVHASFHCRSMMKVQTLTTFDPSDGEFDSFVTPSHQYPLGVTMTLQRRLALLEWARRQDAFILEDDYDSDYRYRGRPLPSLQGLDNAGRVIYMGSFSKTILPSLRLGFLVLPGELVEPFLRARAVLDGHSPTPYQAVLADF